MAVTIDKPVATTKEGDDVVVLDHYDVSMVIGDFPTRFAGTVQVSSDDGVDLTTKLSDVQKVAVKKAQALFDGVLITDAPDSNTPT